MSSWLSKLRQGLNRSSDRLSSSIKQVFANKKLDEATLAELEDALLLSDLGYEVCSKLLLDLKKRKWQQEITPEEVKHYLADQITAMLSPYETALPKVAGNEAWVMCGVNGSGKTTLIGKLAYHYHLEKNRVIVAAADTFRAAAEEQLSVWADRAQAKVIQGAPASDPASVAFQGWQELTRTQSGLLLVDTAGRLHNNKNLMDQLAKIIRILSKQDASLPTHIWLVLDATTGQHALTQVEEFSKVVPLTGLVVNKLDGTAKAGVLVNIATKFKLPIYSIGIGEGIEDIVPFNAKDFATQLLGL